MLTALVDYESGNLHSAQKAGLQISSKVLRLARQVIE